MRRKSSVPCHKCRGLQPRARLDSPEDPICRYLADLLTETREELIRIDSKAALLLAASGVVISALFTNLFGKRWTPYELNQGIEWIWYLGVASGAFGLFFIIAAVYPRIYRDGLARPKVPAYYADVARYKNPRTLRDAIERVSQPAERLADQVFILSRIVHRKYVLLRLALRCLLLAALACTAVVVINIPLGPR